MTNAPNHDDILKKLEEEKQATIKAGKKKSN
jgi:hypothetical protein